MKASLEKAQKWLIELGVATLPRENGTLAVSRDDIDSLCGIGVIYEEFLNELRSALGSNKFTWVDKDREWLYLDTF